MREVWDGGKMGSRNALTTSETHTQFVYLFLRHFCSQVVSGRADLCTPISNTPFFAFRLARY